jgi:hypothetical protein
VPDDQDILPTGLGPLWLLLALFFLRGIALTCALPPGEMWDESAHLAYVDHYAAAGHPAVFGQTLVDPAFRAAISALPQPPAAGFGPTYAQFWSRAPAPPVATAALYEAQQPFLYYAVSTPIYRATGRRSNLIAAVAALRLVNLAFGTAALALILRWLSRTVPGPSAFMLGGWVALQPLLLLNTVRVANDALACLLGTVVIVTALDLQRPRFWPRVIVLAATLPLAILAKFTNAALLPVVLVAIAMIAIRRTRSPRAALAAGTLVVAATAVVLAPYVASNLRTFGLVTPMQEAVVNHAAGRSAWRILTAVPTWRWPGWSEAWWVAHGLWVGGWSFLRPPVPCVFAYRLALGIAGGFTLCRWRMLPVPPVAKWTLVTLLACVQLGLMVHAAESFVAWNGRVTTNSWYAAVAVPWALILLGSGGLVIRHVWLRRAVMSAVPTIFVVTEAWGLFGSMLPTYYVATPLSSVCLRRMAILHPAVLGAATFVAAVGLTVVLLVVVGWRSVRMSGQQRAAHGGTPQ